MPDAGGHSKDTLTMLMSTIENEVRALDPKPSGPVKARDMAWRLAVRKTLRPLLEETEDEDA